MRCADAARSGHRLCEHHVHCVTTRSAVDTATCSAVEATAIREASAYNASMLSGRGTACVRDMCDVEGECGAQS